MHLTNYFRETHPRQCHTVYLEVNSCFLSLRTVVFILLTDDAVVIFRFCFYHFSN